MSELKIPVPPLEEQQRIVSILDEAVYNVAQIEHNYQQEEGSYYELKQSILQEAFNGKLTGRVAA